jgi:hypothetical protein
MIVTAPIDSPYHRDSWICQVCERASALRRLSSASAFLREDISESEVETIRIHENLMRRRLKPSEQARGIARLYELNGVQCGRPEGEKMSPRHLATVAEKIGWSVGKMTRYHTLASLIPELARRWDQGELQRDMACQLAQLPVEHHVDQAAPLSHDKCRSLPSSVKGAARPCRIPPLTLALRSQAPPVREGAGNSEFSPRSTRYRRILAIPALE